MSNPVPSSIALTNVSGVIAASPINTDYAAVQVAVNALITAMGGGTTNQFLQAVDSTHVQWAGGYTAYTPTWTSSGVAPAIGNAVVVAQYLQIGKLVHAYGRITFGTTSTYGTGVYSFALPVTASANAASARSAGTVYVSDSSAGNSGAPQALIPTTTTMTLSVQTTYLGTDSAVGQLVPWTWAQSDIISWNITYEAA